MEKKTIKILGIDPGTRLVGIAIMSGSTLREWRVKTFYDKFTASKVKRILSTLSKICELHQITEIAIKTPSLKSSANLKKIIAGIKEIAKRKKIKLYQYSTKEIKSFFSSINKKELAEILSQQNPFLISELEKEKANRNKYYEKMFVAIGLAQMLYKKLDASPA